MSNTFFASLLTFERVTSMEFNFYYDGGHVGTVKKASPCGKPAWVVVDAPSYMGIVREEVVTRYMRDNLVMILGQPIQETRMSDTKFEWRALTADEQEDWDPAGVSKICEPTVEWEDGQLDFAVVVDENTIMMLGKFPALKPWDPDGLLCFRDIPDHQRGIEMVQTQFSTWTSRQALVDAGFRCEVI